MIKVDDIIPYEKNPRINDEAVEYVANSIKEFGFKVPIVIDKNNVIVTGHTRLKAAKQLGLEEVPCIRADDLTDEQIKAFRIADNKVGEIAEWNDELLLIELDDIDIDMTEFGFDDVFEDEDEPKQTTEDEVPEIDEEAEQICKLGDIWQLGRHRLMCGSSTDKDDVAKLMNGEKGQVLFTSPPYSNMREYEGGKDLSVSNVATFIETYRPYTEYQCVNLGLQRKDFEIVQYWNEYIDIAKKSGYKLMAWNVWNKTMAGSIGMQSAFFPIIHEWIFVFGTEFYEINETWAKKEESIGKKAKERKVRQVDGSTRYSTIGYTGNKYKQMESVVTIASEQGSIRAEHPAVFPVGLPAEYIKSMTQEDENVIEPFGGSGTTLIACEQLNRNCYTMELEPKYCDVIIKRWENFTGEKATKINE